jgi:exopolysaccharide production protein ExoQ
MTRVAGLLSVINRGPLCNAIMAVASLPALTSSPKGRIVAVDQAGPAAYIGSALLGTLVFVSEAVFNNKGDVWHIAFDWQAALRLVVCGACGLYGLFHLRSSVSSLLSGAGLAAVAFGLWAVVTVPFAVNDVHAAAACICLWCVILFAAAVANNLDARLIVRTLAVVILGFLVACWLVDFLYPDMSNGTINEVQRLESGESAVRLGGLTHPTVLGRMAALSIALLLVMGFQRMARWRVLVLPMAFAAITVWMTLTRTSMISAMAVTVVAMLTSMKRARAAAIIFVFVPLVAAVVAFPILSGGVKAEDVATKVSRVGSVEEVYNVNGRIEIWDFALKKISQSPVVGYGYGSSRFVIREIAPSAGYNAHNQLLNVLIETGVVGAGLLLLQIIVLARRFYVPRDLFVGLLLILVVIEGCTENVLFTPIPTAITVLWFVELFGPLRRSLPSV